METRVADAEIARVGRSSTFCANLAPRRKGVPFTMDVSPATRPSIPPPEANTWWWHPNRPGVTGSPSWFEAKLREFDPDIAVTWNRYTERWQVWMRSEKFRSPICWGWKLLFVVKYSDGSYAPLDERIFARLYQASTHRWRNGRDYWLHIEAEMERDKAKAVASRQDDVRATARDYYDYMKIKNYGAGNKFVTHFAG